MRDVIYHDRPRESQGRKRLRIGLSAVLAALVLLLLVLFLRKIERDQGREAEASLRQNVINAAVQCYAIEGAYPSDVTYLEQNYGLSYNASRYRVVLTPDREGGLPDVTVEKRKGAGT